MSRRDLCVAYVTESVKQSGNITYSFADLQQAERRSESATSDCQPNGLETAVTYSADDANDVSSMSLCAWFINATYNPCRVS